MTYRECYLNGRKRLEDAGVPEYDADARLLLEFVCGTDRNTLLAHGDMPVSEEKKAQYLELLSKREKRIPLQLLTGVQCFCGMDFMVNEHVLIPRQDTEILVETALKKLRPGMKILDMCTGSGCIVISLLAMTNGVQGTGVDISEEALKVARENAGRILSKEKQPTFVLSNLFSVLFEEQEAGQTEKYDLIVSNPPYIKSSVMETLMPEVKDHEPRLALDGSEDGLLFYRRIIEESGCFLKENGYLMFEIGCDQGEAVKSLMADAGFTEIEVKKDYAGFDRVVKGKALAWR